ncbi:MAG: Ada metal-binding domain-containing protein [Ginsengibacter sp.]
MIGHVELSPSALRALIRQHKISFGGNERLKIYGSLNCSSGRRMKKANRVFFASEKEAVTQGYRPCGRCMHEKYGQWKATK